MSLTIKQNVVLQGDVSIGKTMSIEGDLSTRSLSISGNVTSNAVSHIIEDYIPLINKPRINNVELINNKTSEELGLEPTIIDITYQDIDTIIFGG